ncbi:enoyl-CoA hydratase-related protein [Derxia gummosa]|uniref:Enoyl-CoA hydratase-related protein n=1 Tax=Derxia gummosa DSM 723 TaxID=1121388 RepID=A0A8B6X3Q7_9BURK|nr:enoyl-CoA hydratase-related protein [Derxia gummosa]
MSLVQHRREGGIHRITLDNPARRNLLSVGLCTALIEAVALACEDPAATAIVIDANGRAFCAGADLDDLKAAAAGSTEAVELVYRAFMVVADAPLPTVAVVQGPAVGAGMNLALACDQRIATTGARFDTRFQRIGLHPGGGHGWMLLRAVGWANANRMLLGGQPVDGAEALRIGLVQHCVEPQALAGLLDAELAGLAAAPPGLVRRAKASLRLAARGSHAEAFAHETAQQMWSLQQPAFAARVTAMQASLSGKTS